MSSPRPDCEFQGQPVSPIRMHMYLDLFPQFSAASDSRATHSGLKKSKKTNEIQGLDAHCCFFSQRGKKLFQIFFNGVVVTKHGAIFLFKNIKI